jgi:hypothetical protein
VDSRGRTIWIADARCANDQRFIVLEPKKQAVVHNQPSRFTLVAALCFAPRSPLFEVARVLVRFNHVASFIVNANHSVMRPVAKLCVVDCAADL